MKQMGPEHVQVAAADSEAIHAVRRPVEDKDKTVSVATVMLSGFAAVLFMAIALMAREMHERRRFRRS